MTLVDVDFGFISNRVRLLSPFIGCVGVKTVFDFLTIVLQFSLNGESFCCRKLSPLRDFLLFNDENSFQPLFNVRDVFVG